MKLVVIIIAEKPDASKHIAKALAEGKVEKKKSSYGVEYYEFKRNGKKHVVVPAVGHLFNLKQTYSGSDYPVFDVDWFPSFQVNRKSAFSEKYFKTVQEIAEKYNGKAEYISACDYDNEGSLIAANILRFIFHVNDAKRMKFSTLAKPDIVKAYEEMLPHLDWENIECGEARHILDFYWGINTSRALMKAVKKFSSRFAILSAGRVQGPTLCLLANREREIQRFKPKPYWQIEAEIKLGKEKVIANYEKSKIWVKKDAEKIVKSSNVKEAVVIKVDRKVYMQKPPAPFNITSLQTEAYRLFGFSPQQTLNIAQSLYENAFISYPRTNSEKLPEQIDYKGILNAIANVPGYKALCKEILSGELKPVEGKKTDPAHEAIHPTVEIPDLKKLTPQQRKIYDLICRRFMACFGKPAKRETMKISLDLGGNKFIVTGRRTVKEGWIKYYGSYASFDETILPDVKKGEKIKVIKVVLLEKETQPPARYTQASIIKEMEKRGLGTRATRAAILQTLYDRGYITGKSIRVTELGMKIAETLQKYVPELVDEKLTRRFEKELEMIFERKVKKEKVIKDAQKELKKIFEEFKKREKKIGKSLESAIIQTHEDARYIGKCPKCGGDLKKLFSVRTKKPFVGCSNYPKCKTSYPLPHGSSIERTEKICEKCNTPIINVRRKGKRPFRMCLDPECETKKKWGVKKV